MGSHHAQTTNRLHPKKLPKKVIMFTYGFWFYEELADKVGLGGGKHHGNHEDTFIELETVNHGNFMVKSSSYRLELFRQNPKCVSCHRVGHLWMLQAHHRNERPHLNLFHVGEECEEWKRLSVDGLVMMTKDHIVPRSLGGPTNWGNLQTMCAICNGKKGNQMHSVIRKNRQDPLIIPPVGVVQNIQGKIQFM